MESVAPTLEQSDPDLAKLLDSLPTPGTSAGRTKAGEKPPKRSERLKARGATTAHTVKVKNLENRMYELFGFMGLAIGGMGDQHCSKAVLENAENMASALNKLAEESPTVAKVLNATLESSAWVNVAMAFGPVVIQVGAHHLGGKSAEEKEEAPTGTRSARTNRKTDSQPGTTESLREIAEAKRRQEASNADTDAVTLAWPDFEKEG